MTSRALESARVTGKTADRVRVVADALRDGVAAAAGRWGVSERSVRRWVADAKKSGSMPSATPGTPQAKELAREIDAASDHLRTARRGTLLKLLDHLEVVAKAAVDAALEEGGDPVAVVPKIAGAIKLVGELDIADRVLISAPAPEAPHGRDDAEQGRVVATPARPSREVTSNEWGE